MVWEFEITLVLIKYSLREKCPKTKFFLVRVQENLDQKKLLFGHFSLSDLNI